MLHSCKPAGSPHILWWCSTIHRPAYMVGLQISLLTLLYLVCQHEVNLFHAADRSVGHGCKKSTLSFRTVLWDNHCLNHVRHMWLAQYTTRSWVERGFLQTTLWQGGIVLHNHKILGYQLACSLQHCMFIYGQLISQVQHPHCQQYNQSEGPNLIDDFRKGFEITMRAMVSDHLLAIT